MTGAWRILHGDCRAHLQTLPAGFFHTAISSPPYWGLRDYGIPGVSWPDGIEIAKRRIVTPLRKPKSTTRKEKPQASQGQLF